MKARLPRDSKRYSDRPLLDRLSRALLTVALAFCANRVPQVHFALQSTVHFRERMPPQGRCRPGAQPSGWLQVNPLAGARRKTCGEPSFDDWRSTAANLAIVGHCWGAFSGRNGKKQNPLKSCPIPGLTGFYRLTRTVA